MWILYLIIVAFILKSAADASITINERSRQRKEWKEVSALANKRLAEIEEQKKKGPVLSDEEYKKLQRMAMHSVSGRRR
ncbi:hypothetical protein B5G34_00395 [Flavonifractor sp. An82]|uniref:hypothetical protein n=1 Tax=Flavonifractor sp. An82 TaxID=1965660 RepID=UPI000B36A001|nr:hypothetical protein [Flavonifractor sp. An82]OUN23594.1 hypothetical protein B5G34_00395 [Flavonifractor sp. An82]